jgi:hypothetical protein
MSVDEPGERRKTRTTPESVQAARGWLGKKRGSVSASKTPALTTPALPTPHIPRVRACNTPPQGIPMQPLAPSSPASRVLPTTVRFVPDTLP